MWTSGLQTSIVTFSLRKLSSCLLAHHGISDGAIYFFFCSDCRTGQMFVGEAGFVFRRRYVDAVLSEPATEETL
jgi:hypothetical protein